MSGAASLYQERVPDPEWLAPTYGIRWTGEAQTLGGQLAKVRLLRDERRDQRLVMRLSDRAHIGGARLARVHRFLAYLTERGVRTPMPLRTRDGRTFAFDHPSGQLVEVFPYVEGRTPEAWEC